MIETKTLSIDGVDYPIRFDSNALFRLDEKTGLTVLQMGIILASGRAGYRMLHQMLWAGLEGGRRQAKTRPELWTMDEVGDLMDKVGGAAMFWFEGNDAVTNDTGEVILEAVPPSAYLTTFQAAWTSAFPMHRTKPKTDPPPPAS